MPKIPGEPPRPSAGGNGGGRSLSLTRPAATPAGKVADTGGKWVRRKVRIVWGKNDREHSHVVEADVLGPLAVHAGCGDRTTGRWVVLHVPTGLVVTHTPREADARRTAETLTADAPGVPWDSNDKDAVVAGLPDWFERWAKATMKADRWLDPGPYRRGEV